jgi:hypothetical protein
MLPLADAPGDESIAAIGAGVSPYPGGEFARWQRTIADLAEVRQYRPQVMVG